MQPGRTVREEFYSVYDKQIRVGTAATRGVRVYGDREGMRAAHC